MLLKTIYIVVILLFTISRKK